MRVMPLVACLMILTQPPALADHSSDVQQLAARGDYFAALSSYERLPRRRATTGATLAAARSAWALSLPDAAIERFEEALADEELPLDERARATIARGIIEYQEGHYQTAGLYAEKGVQLLAEPGPLRARGWQLWGESFAKLNSWAAAEEKYLKALEEARAEDRSDLNFALGVCRLRLGKAAEARQAFEQVPLSHERAAEAVRHLAQIAIDSGEYKNAAFWLATGRQRYPDGFLDSWVDYALVRAAIAAGDREELDRLLASAEERLPASDYWLTLAQGSAAAFHWSLSSRGGQK